MNARFSCPNWGWNSSARASRGSPNCCNVHQWTWRQHIFTHNRMTRIVPWTTIWSIQIDSRDPWKATFLPSVTTQLHYRRIVVKYLRRRRFASVADRILWPQPISIYRDTDGADRLHWCLFLWGKTDTIHFANPLCCFFLVCNADPSHSQGVRTNAPHRVDVRHSEFIPIGAAGKDSLMRREWFCWSEKFGHITFIVETSQI